MLKAEYPYYLGGEPLMPNTDLAVTDKYSGRIATRVALASESVMDSAVALSAAAAPAMAKMASYERQEVLNFCVARFTERFEELAVALCIEAGKPIRDARGEVTRLIDTFRIAAEESVRMCGEVLPMDISARAKGYTGIWKRVPIGPCSFITPFNFPLNLVAHKVAPAIAVGCPFVLKPASLTPIGALIVGEILSQTGLPKGSYSVLPCPRELAARFVTDERIKFLSFTGSQDVGWDIKARAGRKKVALELGGNAAVVIEPDADIDDAVARIIFGAYYQSGQSCVSVQRIIARDTVYDELRDKLIAAVSKLKMGDPGNEDTFIGPIISVKEAERVEGLIRSAVERGARVLCGGNRTGAMVEATLMENVPADHPLTCREVFGPVAMLYSSPSFEESVKMVNSSAYGLQAGVFTRDIGKVLTAWDELEVGAVMINEVPSFRVDHMPYGGVKQSGLGREGIRFAMEEMTEIRLLGIRGR